MRVGVLDGIRGHLLIMMMLAHLSWQPQMGFLGVVHHAKIIGLFDAEFLIYMSGMLVGFLFVSRLTDRVKQSTFLRQRLAKIYRFYVYSAVPFLVMAVIDLTISGQFGSIFKPLAQVLVMQNGGGFSDVLPIYIYCFALLLLALPLIERFGPWSVLAPSAMIYLASHLSYSNGFFGLSGLFMSFDVSAWQFLFFIAFATGADNKRIGAAISRLDSFSFSALLLAGIALTLAQRTWSYYPHLIADPGDLATNWARMQLHPYYLLRILLVSGLVALFLVRDHPLTRGPQQIMNWYFNLGLLRLAGKYSIQIFVFHVYLMALYMTAAPEMVMWQRILMSLSLMALFLASPLAWDRFQNRSLQSRTVPAA